MSDESFPQRLSYDFCDGRNVRFNSQHYLWSLSHTIFLRSKRYVLDFKEFENPWCCRTLTQHFYPGYCNFMTSRKLLSTIVDLWSSFQTLKYIILSQMYWWDNYVLVRQIFQLVFKQHFIVISSRATFQRTWKKRYLGRWKKIKKKTNNNSTGGIRLVISGDRAYLEIKFQHLKKKPWIR